MNNDILAHVIPNYMSQHNLMVNEYITNVLFECTKELYLNKAVFPQRYKNVHSVHVSNAVDQSFIDSLPESVKFIKCQTIFGDLNLRGKNMHILDYKCKGSIINAKILTSNNSYIRGNVQTLILTGSVENIVCMYEHLIILNKSYLYRKMEFIPLKKITLYGPYFPFYFRDKEINNPIEIVTNSDLLRKLKYPDNITLIY